MQIDDDDDVMEVSCIPADDDDNDENINTVRLSRCISLNIHKQMMIHVVWPRRLPSKYIETNDHETAMVAVIADTLEWLENGNACVASSAKLFRSLFNTKTSNDAQILADELHKVKHGDMFAFFVKGQNCGLSVYVPPSVDNSSLRPKSAIVSTFPVSIPKEEIYEVEHSEFQMEFPNRSVEVDFSTMLNSQEFSQQLCHLNDNMVTSKRDDNAFVSQWLVPMLSTHQNSVIRQTDYPIISKKIRDDVVGTNNQVMPPFRRSTYWQFLKVILQFNLTVELGEMIGKIMYKVVMLRAMTILCLQYNKKMYSTLKVDVVMHVLAKLARRIEKIDNLISLLDDESPNRFDAMPAGFEQNFNATIDEAKLTIFKVKEKLDRQIAQIQNDEEENSRLVPLSRLDFVADVQQKVPNLRKYLETRQAPAQLCENHEKLNVKFYVRHSVGSVNAPDPAIFDKLKNPVEIDIFLCDFENWILYALYDFTSCTPETLRSLSFGYARLAAQYYKDDPLSFSRVVLTQMKILTLLDKIAIDAHKMLKKHRAGIHHAIFDSLILPHYEDYEIAHDLKKYFMKRCSKATYPSLLEEEKVTSDSFAARFAEKSDEMQEIIKRIQQSTDATIAKIQKEWEMQRKELTGLRKKLETMDCVFVVNSNGKREHKSSCPSCKLTTKIVNARVSTFELPLPEVDFERNAIAFELCIPVEIACLRDVLYEVVKLLNEPTKNMRIFGKWSESDILDEFSESKSERVFLGNTVKCKAVGRTRAKGVHPDQPFDSCTLKNDRSCILYAGQVAAHIPTVVENQSLTKFATLNVEKGSPYESLQWTLVGTNHTQNQVIARQFECPQSLTLSEFKNFGSLRADGHRLQIRKLYAMIETESLSFETLSVQALIMQTLWEVGPSNALAFQWNESHQDFTDPIFASAMVDLIDKFINTQKCNWKHPLKLMMTALIAVRVYEFNDDENVADRIVQLLVKLRDIAHDWLAKVQMAMHETPAGSQSDMEKLRQNLVEISIAGALTFFVHFRNQYFDKIFIGSIMKSITAVRFWLEFLVTINDNILMSDKKDFIKSSAKLNREMLRRLVHRIAVQIESKIKGIVVNDPSDVFEFIKLQWSRARNGNFKFKIDKQFPETLIVMVTIDNTEHSVQIGIISGEFLVNNMPVSRLPKTITEHPVFQRVFDEFIFEVHQEASCQFDTKYQYENSHFSFLSRDGEVIVTERKVNGGDEYELIPEQIFAGEIPHLLIENHSHWWCKTKKIIEFRPIRFRDSNFSSPDGVQFELDLNSGTLVHKKTKKMMLDVTSGSFSRIAYQLSRLESVKYIHVYIDEPQIAKVELVRMNIKFLVDASKQQKVYEVVSNEFNGMRICTEQNYGTLYGLRQGLLLESIQNGKMRPKKLMILPHGKVTARIVGNHEVVEINVETTLRSPTFFIYQMDEMCQQLKASNRSFSAWLYLAYIHGLTSHGLPEPFTEMSGTERALQILQSPFTWSTQPYDDEALVTLKLIEKLAPSRKNKNNLQSVRWPDFIESHAAQDGYLFITSQLIVDSQRLNGLHPKGNADQSTKEKKESLNRFNNEIELKASVREYFRCLPYFPNLRLSQIFIPHKIAVSAHYIHHENEQKLHAIRTISNLYHQQKFQAPKSFSLTAYLTKSDNELKGPWDVDDTKEILRLYSSKNVRDEWLSLYNVARSAQFSREKFALVLGLLAYGSTDVDDLNAILLLQTVAENSVIFNALDPPEIPIYNLMDRDFNYQSVERILEQHQSDPDYGGRYNEMIEIRQTLARRNYIHAVVTKISRMWPCEQVDSSIYQCVHPDVNLRAAVIEINQKLRHWMNIERLMIFLRKIGLQIRRLNTLMPDNDDTIVPWNPEKLPYKRFTKFYVNFDAKIQENLPLFETDVREAEQSLTQRRIATTNDWWFVYKSIAMPTEAQHLVDAGMYPRLVFSLVLPKLLSSTENPKLKAIICAVGVQIVAEQRKRRIAIYSQKPEMEAALDEEVQNEPHTNWLPYEYPEWLLFEIEQDLTIRPIQIEVAKRMINPPEIGAKHSVMQLNMGEGKTAVIVPILAAILANGKQVCQVTVLKSLFATNLKELRQCLGGMLNRRLYTFPCRRDMPIKKYAEKLFEIYMECRHLKGVVLTLPEYRLSFQLKIYEAPSKDETECAKVLLQIHRWMDQNVRNILDESDAILQPKYQMIYTMGEQLSLDGGAQRWTVIQGLLKRLPYHLKKLWEHFGDEKIEYDNNYVKNGQIFGKRSIGSREDVFTPCRIFDDYVYDVLKKKLIDDVLSGSFPNISLGVAHSVKEKLKLFLNEGVSADIMDDLTTTQQTTMLILSGFLKYNVLQLVLGKRWRVNYGVNESGPRKMAIPFKAKDVAAEMTEFGHPDVAVCLTQLSYYYSGLSETQLHQVFKILESQQNSAEIYEGWIRSVPYQLVDDTIQSYTGVNLSDPKQRNEKVFPLFKHNMCVIDYWLSNLVFPREAKTFEQKLMCTAWDLVSDNFTHTVSGFSGTNDTKNILPLPIKQNDLKELERTNDNVRNILLRTANEGYFHLPANVRGLQILIEISKLKIPVLLDAGACMLELNNEQVATQWLNFVDPKLFDATVYFDSNNVMMTVDRNGITTEFDYSVYRNKLDRCLVYLDDAHTRGTDLKFPLNWKACVTLSGDITRDKTVQACMRMRLLGKGHSIVFMASYEADVRIRDQCNLGNATPKSKHVLDFIGKNSQRFEEDNMIHWVRSAFNYTKKLAAHKMCATLDEAEAVQVLHTKCRDNEYVTLKDMYGTKETVLLSQISKNLFDKFIASYRHDSAITDIIRSVHDAVNAKLIAQAHFNVQRFTQSFDEEQEKELEHELEEQRQVERPPPAIAAIPVYNDLLENLVNQGASTQSFRRIQIQKGIMSLDESLQCIPAYSAHKHFPSPWSKNVYVTKDFVNVVEGERNSNEYLRPVWWIAHIVHRESDDIFLLLSSYEANILLPLFRKSSRSTLMCYRSRLSQFHSNLLHDIPLQVTGMNSNTDDHIGLYDEVQIGMYAGAMYFGSHAEQEAYCGFMGLIPNPRTPELEIAFEEGIITANSYVPPENRKHSAAVSRFVRECKFYRNPVELAIQILEAHHQFVRKESHVSAILEMATKKKIN